MRTAFFFTLIIFSFIASGADELQYSKTEFISAPLPHISKLDSFFSEEGYIAMANPEFGVPSLGINQIYFKDEDQFVYVKYGVEGNFKLNEIIDTPSGFMVHEKSGDQTYLLYFRGLNSQGVKLFMSRLRNNLTVNHKSIIPNLFIPEAHATDDCGAVGPDLVRQMTDFSRLSASMVWNFSKNCITGLGAGVWGSTGGRISSGLSNLWQAVRHPIATAESIGNKISNFITGLASFTRGIITDPRGTLNRLGSRIGAGWNRMVDVVTNMSTDLKVQFICSLIGSLGIDAAIVFFTAGAGSVRLAATLAQLAERFTLVARVFSALSSLSQAVRAGMALGPEKMKNFMNRLMAGRIPDEDLRHIDDLTGADSRLGLGALSCSI